MPIVTPAQQAQTPAGQDAAPNEKIVRTLPAFAYPLRPQYSGTGDVNDAASYVPVLPVSPAQDDFDWIGRSTLSP